MTNRRNDITQGWQFCSPPWKRKGKKRKKNVITRRGIRIRSPIQVRTATCRLEYSNEFIPIYSKKILIKDPVRLRKGKQA